MNLGKSIKEARKKKRLSQIELALEAGITQAALSQIENGQRPSEETLRKLCKALNVSESFLYIAGLEKEDVPENKRVLYDELFPVIKELLYKVGL